MALGTLTDSASNTISLSQATYTDAERTAAINNAKTSAAMLAAIGMTADQVAALSGANDPSGTNVVATMADIPDVPEIPSQANMPTSDQKAALTGTSGTPSASNPYATKATTDSTASALTSHTGNTSNPHAVTKTQVGLGNVDNTSDANKPVSSATQTALNAKQPLDADLTAIAELSGTAGLLRKTAADTWSLDTNVYLTGNETITLSGDATGSGTTAITVTLANSGVSAGSYGSATAVPAITVDAKGRVTAAANVIIQIAQSQVTDLGTALSAKAPAITPINAQTGTTYSLVAADAGKIVTCTNASAITVTVPASTFSAGKSVIIGQGGAGQVTLAAGSGMTLHTTTTLKAKAQYARIAVMFDSASEGTVIGERAAS